MPVSDSPIDPSRAETKKSGQDNKIAKPTLKVGGALGVRLPRVELDPAPVDVAPADGVSRAKPPLAPNVVA